MSFTEQEILQVLTTAHPDEIPLSPEAIAERIERLRESALKEADIRDFATWVNDWIADNFEMQSSKVRWTAVVNFLDNTLWKLKRELKELGY